MPIIRAAAAPRRPLRSSSVPAASPRLIARARGSVGVLVDEQLARVPRRRRSGRTSPRSARHPPPTATRPPSVMPVPARPVVVHVQGRRCRSGRSRARAHHRVGLLARLRQLDALQRIRGSTGGRRRRRAPLRRPGARRPARRCRVRGRWPTPARAGAVSGRCPRRSDPLEPPRQGESSPLSGPTRMRPSPRAQGDRAPLGAHLRIHDRHVHPDRHIRNRVPQHERPLFGCVPIDPVRDVHDLGARMDAADDPRGTRPRSRRRGP